MTAASPCAVSSGCMVWYTVVCGILKTIHDVKCVSDMSQYRFCACLGRFEAPIYGWRSHWRSRGLHIKGCPLVGEFLYNGTNHV